MTDSRPAAAPDASRPVAQTATGTVAGVWDSTTGQARFWGIPYAEAPVGPLRFKPPVPKKPWEGVFSADRFGPSGPQIFDPSEGSYEEFTGEKPGPNQNPWVGAEDHLYLNVWTRQPDPSARKPVIVWIHGGANWLESSRLSTYHGDSIVARGDVVFVSLNYRLNIFGWVDVSVLGGEEYRGSHSHGLHDQITALRWIRENIAAFGGDPDNITIMGESAGSINISWLLTNGHLDGIARRVVMMSGIAGLIGLSGDLRAGFSEEYGQELARDYLTRLNIRTMDELLSLSTDEIMARVAALNREVSTLFYMDSIFWPRVSPEFAPQDPFRAAASGGGQGIDVMIGYTAYEMGLWLTWDQTLDRHPCLWSAEKILDFSPAQQQDAARHYDACFADDVEGARGMHLIGDSIFVMPSLWFADAFAARGGRVWMYQFDWQADDRHRAQHAADQTYLFDKHDTDAGRHLLGLPASAEDRAARKALTAAMQDAVVAFARHGDPDRHDNPNLPRWPLYRVEDRAAMSFDLSSRVVTDPAGPRRAWWYENIYEPALNPDRTSS